MSNRFSTLALGGLFAVLGCAGSAEAASVLYVSGKGNDANACDTIAAPCLTLQAAHNKVDAGGEILVLDSASYGPVAITKSVSIVNDGAGVADVQQTLANKDAITISGNGTVAHLRGLSIDGGGIANYGVRVINAAAVTITNCVARRFVGGGYLVRTSTIGVAFSLIDSTASDNVGKGVYLFPASGSINALLSNVEAVGNGQQGVYASGAVTAAISGGNFSKSAHGVYAAAGSSISVRDAVANNNSTAGFMAVGAGAVVRLAHSVASGNRTGLQATSGGVAETYSDNNLRANEFQTAGATAVVRQ